jgi:hypothetical protein
VTAKNIFDEMAVAYQTEIEVVGVVLPDDPRPAKLAGTPFSATGPGRFEYGRGKITNRSGPWLVWTKTGTTNHADANIIDTGGARLEVAAMDIERLLLENGWPLQLSIRLDPFQAAFDEIRARTVATQDAEETGAGYIYRIGDLFYRLDPENVETIRPKYAQREPLEMVQTVPDDLDALAEKVRAILAIDPPARPTWHESKPETPIYLDAYIETDYLTGRRRVMIWKGGQCYEWI